MVPLKDAVFNYVLYRRNAFFLKMWNPCKKGKKMLIPPFCVWIVIDIFPLILTCVRGSGEERTSSTTIFDGQDKSICLGKN